MDVRLINPFIKATTDVLEIMAFVEVKAGTPYLKNDNLYIRASSERYQTEHLFKSGVTGKLIKIGMNDKNRLQFMIRK